MLLRQLLIKRFPFLILVSCAILVSSASAQTSRGTSPQCETVPGTLYVKLVYYYEEWPWNPLPGEVVDVSMDTYTLGVMMGELGPTVPEGDYQGQDWDFEVLRAQATAARTFGSYFCKRRDLGNGKQGLYDGQPDAEFRPYHSDFSSSRKQLYYDRLIEVKGIYITWDGLRIESPYDGKLLDAEFRRDVNDPSCSWRSSDTRPGCTLGGDVTGYEYLASINNPYTIGRSDGPGWAQTPSHGWTRDGSGVPSWVQLLQQYYTGIWFQGEPRGANWLEQSWRNTDCSGPYALADVTDSINYDWEYGAANDWVDPNYFCIKWSQDFYFSEDWYTFYLLVDDGARLYIDGDLVLDKWIVQAPTLYSITVYLTEGNHDIMLKYFENTGLAVARLSFFRGFGMIAEYYDDVIAKVGDPGYFPIMVRPDNPIRFAWHTHSPLDTREPSGFPRIIGDTFSIRWQGYLRIPQCRTYRFWTRTDDGAYLTITHASGEVEALIDEWYDQGPTAHFGDRYLCPGTYPLEARYYENGGWATISFWIE